MYVRFDIRGVTDEARELDGGKSWLIFDETGSKGRCDHRNGCEVWGMNETEAHSIER